MFGNRRAETDCAAGLFCQACCQCVNKRQTGGACVQGGANVIWAWWVELVYLITLPTTLSLHT